MRWINVVLAIYALVLIASGIQAYVFPLPGDKVSLISLIAGVGIGALVLGSLALAQTNPRPARIGAAVLTIFVMGRFIPSFFSSGRIYPAGILGFGSLIVFLCLGAGHMLATRARKRGELDPQIGSVSDLDPITGRRRSEVTAKDLLHSDATRPNDDAPKI